MPRLFRPNDQRVSIGEAERATTAGLVLALS
jgi:hypothetical protein